MTPQELSARTGEVIGVSEWLEVSQERINQFETRPAACGCVAASATASARSLA